MEAMGGNRTDRAPHAPIRVVLAEDSYIIREFLTTTLSSAPEVELVAVCSNAKELQTAIDTWAPDVVLTDIRMPPSGADDGIRIAARLRETAPARSASWCCSQYAEPAYALALLEHGTGRRAYLLKERIRNRDELIGAIEKVAHGGSVIDPAIVDVLIAGEVAGGPFAARGAHAPGAGAARRDRRGQEQRGDRRIAVSDQTGGREARQLDLLQARPARDATTSAGA